MAQNLRSLSRSSLAFFGAASTLAVACSQGQISQVGSDASSGNDGAAQADAGLPQDGAAACRADADCPSGDVCGFPPAGGCSAAGTCFPAPGAVCQAYSPGCACDGTDINVACTGLPGGSVSRPLLHTGACASDAGLDAMAPMHWYSTCGDPVCHVSPDGGSPDAGLTDDAGAPCPPVGSLCASRGQTCGTRDPNVNCGATEVCSDHDPKLGFGGCPISTRRLKNGIEYIDGAELEQLHDEALRIRLATYSYKPEVGDENPKHLGFVIEDDPQSPAVDRVRSRVDMYGYVSMVVAAMQVQEKEIAELRGELAAARRGVCAGPRK